LENYGNLQHRMTATNIDDITLDILQLKKFVQYEQTQISLLNAKLDIIHHIVKDTEKIKQAMDIVATKLEKRLDSLGTMMVRDQDLRK
jgi:hypothetical protein